MIFDKRTFVEYVGKDAHRVRRCTLAAWHRWAASAMIVSNEG